MLAPTFAEPAIDARDLYLDLMKRALMNTIYGDCELTQAMPRNRWKRALHRLLHRLGFEGGRLAFDPHRREEGRDWPAVAHTMIGRPRLDNLQECLETVLRDDIPGDCIETGVWRGGASIFMRAVLKAHGITDRTVWLADSFCGLPPPRADYPQDSGSRLHRFDQLAVSQSDVEANFERYGLLDDQVRFLAGWFSDTLPRAPVERLAVLRLDGDMYQSTMDALVHLYPKLSVGGYVIIDDYGPVPACCRAVHDYRRLHGITEDMVSIDWAGVFWRRAR